VRAFGAVAVLAVLLAGLLAIVLFSPGESRQDVYLPLGYVEEVERLVAAGKLRYLCQEDRIEAVGLSPAEETFYRHSYLVDDVEAFNDGDRRAFLVEREESRNAPCEGRITAVNPSFHNQRLPGYVAEAWRGSLLLRPVAGGTTLDSGEHTFEITPVPWQRLEATHAGAYEDAWLRGGAASVRSERLALKLLRSGSAFATAKYVGDQAVLEIKEEGPSVVVDGCELPLGWRMRLDGGEALSFHQPRVLDERFAVEAGERAGLVSFLTRVNGEPERRSYPERLSVAREVAQAIDSVVGAARRADRESFRDDFDVHLTLDPFLTDRLEERMAGVLGDRYGRRPLRAGVTVLDAGTGRLLALASYPRSDDLDALGLGTDGGRRGAAAARRELLRRNHNFLQHAAGSAAKPFLTAAILAAEPRLADLRVRCFGGGQPPDTLLGYGLGEHHLPGDCKGADAEGWIDLESFLTVSSNRYVLYLGLLSMAEWGPEGPRGVPGAPLLPESERYRLGDRSFSVKPELRVAREEDDDPTDPTTPRRSRDEPRTELQEVDEQSGFGRAFRDLFDQRVRYRRERTAEAFDLRPWEPVLRAAYDLSGDDGPAPRPDEVASFAPVAAERVNLRLNLVQQLRQDLYTLLLGNGANRWSNVQLAEAMARLVTGRAVEARLVERVVVPPERSQSGTEEVLWALDGQPEPPNLADRLAAPLRERILAGLRGAVEAPQGTAAPLGGLIERLNRRAPPGVHYSAVAKTGTPTLPLSVARRTASDIHPEAVKRYGEGQDRQVESAVLVLAIRREAPAGEGTEDLAVAVYIESQGGSREAVTLAATLLEPLVESRWPDDFSDVAR
jgi:cell division protein FtsI/penicillin-binding protein 2